MALYAQDAMETDKPWERWKWRAPGGTWTQLNDHPVWGEGIEYRRKPQVILVNGIEVPAPETKAPAPGTTYFIADPANANHQRPRSWVDKGCDHEVLKRGLVHLTPSVAIAHAKAMLAWKKGGAER